MDRDRFDALARLLAAKGSRRGALSAILGAALFGHDPEASLAKPGKRKGKGRDTGRGKGRGRDNDQGRGGEQGKGRGQKRGRDRQRVRAEAIPANCCSGVNCAPGSGKDLAKCCYQGQDLTGGNFKAVNLGSANLSGATLTNANFTAANLDKTCFVGANLTGAKLTGTNTGTAIFCNTTMPDGSTNNRDCAKGTTCCETCVPACTGNLRCCPDGTCKECCANGQCPAGQRCVNGRCVCDAVSCPGGCCTNGPGNPGECRPRSDTNCGINGARCVDCPDDTVCNAQGQCGCNRQSCPDGCCDTATGPCIRTPSNQNCGGAGNICRDCTTTPAAPVCVDGQCVCPAPRVVCNNICCTAGQVCDTRLDPDVCCTPETVDQTCGVGPARRCGQVTDNCGQQVNCGNCAPVTCRVVACQGNTCVVTGNQPNLTTCATAAGGPGICCDGACVAGVCCANADCTGGAANTCTNNQCRCGTGPVCTEPNETCCGTTPQGACIDTTTDPSNCGACGNVCPTGRCVGGECAPCISNANCGAGRVCCGGVCHEGTCCALRGPCGPDAPCCSGPNNPDRACCVQGRCCLVSPGVLPPTVCGDGDCCTDICLAGVEGSRLCGPRNLPICPG